MKQTAKAIGFTAMFLMAAWGASFTTFHATGHVLEVTHALADRSMVANMAQDSCVSPIISVYTFGHMC